MRHDAQVQFGDWSIHYSVQGSGPALLLLHGAIPGGRGERAFARNIEAFAAHFTTYVLDFPGWGKSSKNLQKNDEWNNPLKLGGKVVEAFVSSLGLNKVSIVGNSFGAAAALYFAMERPENVDRLVLVAPGGGQDSKRPGPMPSLLRLLTYYVNGAPSYEQAKTLLNDMCFDKTLLTESLLQEFYQDSLDPDVIANPQIRIPPGYMPTSADMLCYDPRLTTLPCRVLFVWGRQDEMQSLGCLESFANIPDQEAVLLNRCGHWPHREHAERFNRMVIEWLGMA